MSVLLPITTLILVFLGAFCLFISADNRKKTFLKRNMNPNPQEIPALLTSHYEAPGSVFRE